MTPVTIETIATRLDDMDARVRAMCAEMSAECEAWAATRRQVATVLEALQRRWSLLVESDAVQRTEDELRRLEQIGQRQIGRAPVEN